MRGILLRIALLAAAIFVLLICSNDKQNWEPADDNLCEDNALSQNLHELVNLSPEKFVNLFPIFLLNQSDPTEIVLPRGTYDIDRSVVVPRNVKLKIEPGVKLHFRRGCSLISYSPIFARGTKSDSIVFSAYDDDIKWGVVGLVDTEESVFEYVKFEFGRQAVVNQIAFDAGLTALQTDVEVKNSSFINMCGKDAVNVQFANVLIRDSVFEQINKDGVDVDNCSGEISSNRFVNCSDEGIDLSANYNIKVFNNTILDQRGGRIGAEHNFRQILAQNKFGYYRRPIIPVRKQ